MMLIWRQNRFSVYAAFWSLGTLVAYSISGYKTPWLVLNMLIPMSLVGGILLAEVPIKALRYGIVAALCVVSLWSDVTMNLYNYDDDRNPYVYEQTQRGFYGLTKAISDYSIAHNDGGQTAIAIVSPDYWPLPWYIRHDSDAAYYGKIQKLPYETKLIIAEQNQLTEIVPQLGNGFKLQGSYALRPGVVLYLYVRDF
jgi:predicted membrane-bound mannosyltransferase